MTDRFESHFDRAQRLLGALSLCALATLVGCSDADESGSSSCSGNTQCPVGQVCDVRLGSCNPESPNEAVGGFSCVLDSSAINTAGGAQIIANLAGTRYVLGTSGCVSNSSVVSVTVAEIDTSGVEVASLTVTVDRNRIVPGTLIPLLDNTANEPLAAVGTGSLWRGSTPPPEYLGLVSGGWIRFDQVPTSGAALSGNIEVTLRGLGGSGGSCTDGRSGASDCDECLTAAQASGGCCAAESAQCAGNTQCLPLLQCINACPQGSGDMACFTDCENRYAGGIDDLVALINCFYGSSSAGSVGACGQLCL